MTIINTKNLFLFSFFVYLVTNFLDIFYKYNFFWFISVIIYLLLIFVFIIYTFIEDSSSKRFDGFLSRYLIGYVFIFFQLVDTLVPFWCGIGRSCPYDPNSYSIFLNIIFYVGAILTLGNKNRKIPVKK